MKSSDFYTRASLERREETIADGSLLNMLLQLDGIDPADREGYTIVSQALGPLTAETAAKILQLHRTSNYAD